MRFKSLYTKSAFLLYNFFMDKEEISKLLNDACDLIADSDYNKAKELLDEVLKFEADNFEANKTMGLVLVNLDDRKQAARYFEKTVKLDKNDAISWYYLGNCYDKEEEQEKAEKAYLKVIELREEFYEAYKSLGVLYLKSGDYNKIIENLSKITEVGSDDFQSFYVMASAYMAIGNEEKAAELLKKAHELVPEHIQIINNLSSCLIATGKIEEAFEYLQKAEKLDEKNSQTNFNIGTIYQLKSNYNKAIDYFDKAYLQDPTVATLTSLASCMMSAKRYDSAYTYYSTLLTIYPDNINYLNNTIKSAIETSKAEEALKLIEEALKKLPKSIDLIKKKGYLLVVTGKNKEAAETLETLVKRGKIDYEIYYNLGIAQARSKNFEAAKENLRNCIRLEPDNPVARKDLGVLYLYMNFVDWALDELKTAYEMKPNDFDYVYNYAFALHKSGNYGEADKFFKKTLELGADDSVIYSSYADNLCMLQKKEEAFEMYKKAISLNPKNVQAAFGLSKLCFADKKYNPALELLLDLIEYTDNDEILNLLGRTYKALNKYKEAAGVFKILTAKYPDNHIILTDMAECLLKLDDKCCAKEYAMKALNKYKDYEPALKILKEVTKDE